eukprot:SAG22_NODE_766_length_7392_cov_4.700123_1_plen_188_part_10
MARRRYEQRQAEKKSREDIQTDEMSIYADAAAFSPSLLQADMPAGSLSPEALNCSMIAEAINRLSKQAHFNIVLLAGVKPAHMIELRRDQGKELVTELANTYAFQMAPAAYEELFRVAAVHSSSQGRSSLPDSTHAPVEISFKMDVPTDAAKELRASQVRVNDLLEPPRNSDGLADCCYMGHFIKGAV